MDTTALFVEVRWEMAALPPGRVRVVASGPSLRHVVAALDRRPPASRPASGGNVADEHLVADADGAGPWPGIADVLIVRGGLSRRAAVRRDFPGALVVVFSGPGEMHFLETATGWLARLVPLPDGVGDALWPYASFVHAWTTAGRSLDALDGAHLRNGPLAGEHGVRVSVVGGVSSRRAAA